MLGHFLPDLLEPRCMKPWVSQRGMSRTVVVIKSQGDILHYYRSKVYQHLEEIYRCHTFGMVGFQFLQMAVGTGKTKWGENTLIRQLGGGTILTKNIQRATL